MPGAISITDVFAAMYEQRTMVRWMAMRRTLFVVAREDIPIIQSAVSTPLAASLRRRLLNRLDRNGVEPPVDEDLPGWLRATEQRVEQVLRFGPATVDDLEWWTGWNKTTTRAALGRLDLDEVDLHGRSGIDLAGTEFETPPERAACLLPSFDPTPITASTAPPSLPPCAPLSNAF